MSLLKKLINIYEYILLMGTNWFFFRLKYELLKKINYFEKVNKTILYKVEHTSEKKFTYKKIDLINSDFKADGSFIKKADEAIRGKFFSFSNEYLNYCVKGKINWQMNPISKIKAKEHKSWNNLPDFGEYGDIKLIWEASRFPQVYFYINAYSITKEKKYAKTCIEQIIDWIEENPFPRSVNYKCGQEITFRVFSWIHALEYFNCFISKHDEKIIVRTIYISLLRIEANIEYALKSVKNNHSISEAAGLLIGGLLFSQFKESKRFIERGKKYLLQESSYQVYDDGSYLQHSFNYQRLVLDIISFVMCISQKLNFSLPEELKKRQQKMIVFLNSFIQKNGWLPNYGSNDGANLFPITECDYRDYRSSLNFASILSNGYSLFTQQKQLIDFFNLEDEGTINIKQKIEFKDGGYYILKNKSFFSFLRCHSYKNRPCSNDMLHLDIWVLSNNSIKNLFCDAGSYSYNIDKEFKNNFTGVIGHNTVMINDSNQMEQVLNFGYSNWTKAKCINFNQNCILSENYAYKKDFGILHQREVKLKNDKIIVLDDIKNIKKDTNIKQIWNTKLKVNVIDDYSFKVAGYLVVSNVKYKLKESYISDYYNAYDKATRVIFEIDTVKDFQIKTQIEKKE